jgi:PAS domain S-box-containing protein
MHRDSFDEIEQLFDAVPVGLAVIDRDLRYLRINRFLAAINAKPAEEHIGRHIREMIPSLADEVGRMCQGVFATGESMIDVEFSGGPETAQRRIQTDYHPLKAADGTVGAVAIVCRNTTERRRAERIHEERLRFEALLADLSAAFVNVATGELREEMQRWLARIVDLLQVERGTVGLFSADGTALEIVCSYTVPGFPPLPLGRISGQTPWFTRQVCSGSAVVVSRLPEDLPAEAAAEREFCGRLGVKAILILPLVVRGRVVGSTALVALRQATSWSEDVVRRITMVGQVFAGAIERRRAEESLRKHETMLSQVLDAVPQQIFWKDRDSVYLGCNATFAKSVGIERPELVAGKDDFEICLLRHEAEAYRADDREVIQTNRAKRHIIEPQQQPDGTRLWLDTSKAPLRDAHGEVYGVLGVYEDITERKRTEDALRESEERYRTIFARSPIGIELYDADGRQLTINAAAMKIFGIADAADVADFNLFDGTSLTDEIKERLRRGEPVEYEATFDFGRIRELGQYETARTGTAQLQYVIAPLLHAGTSAIRGYLLHVGDISEPRRAEAAVRRRAALDALIAANVARLATAASAEIDGCILTCLEEMARFIGARNAYVLQFSADFVTWSRTCEWCDSSVVSYHDDYQQVPMGTHSWLERMVLDGHVVEVRRLDDLPGDAAVSRQRFEVEGQSPFFLVPVRGQDGRYNGCIGFSWFAPGATWSQEDISSVKLAGDVITNALERRRAELQSQQLREQLVHATRVSTLGEFTAALAHELNQPLAAARAYAEGCLQLLRGGEMQPARIGPALQDIVGEIARAGEVIGHLRNLVQRRPLRRSSTDLNRLIQDAVKIVAPGLRDRDIRLETNLASALPLVSADAVQIQQVVLNLVQNSIDALTTHNGRRWIAIATRAEGNNCLVEVKDSGPGIPATARRKVFEPYFSTKAEGLGLGLPISRTIVEAHGGCLEIDTGQTEGGLMRMTLPRIAGD